MIKICKCEHKAQDELHGKSKRVFNKTKKMAGTQAVWRCTVCKSEQAQTSRII